MLEKIHHSKERTLVIIKVDGVQRSLIGEIIRRIEKTGLKLVGLKFSIPKQDKIEKHYSLDPKWLSKVGEKAIQAYKDKGQNPPSLDPEVIGKNVLGNLVKYLSSGPAVQMVWQGAHAVAVVRKLIGSTEPLTSDVGTVRGDYVIDSYEMSDVDGRAVRNLVHASSDKEEAKKEIDLWFKDEELINYRLVQEQVLYDVNLDGLIE
jgi:nucleoside-diphosphate kinase